MKTTTPRSKAAQLDDLKLLVVFAPHVFADGMLVLSVVMMMMMMMMMMNASVARRVC